MRLNDLGLPRFGADTGAGDRPIRREHVLRRSLTPGGGLIVLDAGTGIIPLGLELAERGVRSLHLLLTHLHLDHLEGLRFFAPLWDDRVKLDIWGPPSPLLSLRERISRSFSPPLFPIDLRHVPAQVTFRDVPRRPWTIDRASLTADLVVHPGPTVGFRIETSGSSVRLPARPRTCPRRAIRRQDRGDWISGASIAADADLLVHDAQYFEDEYVERMGWGHSSVADAVAFTHAVGARRLVLFHHEPRHDDDSLARLEGHARSLAGPNGLEPTLAREGMVLEVP